MDDEACAAVGLVLRLRLSEAETKAVVVCTIACRDAHLAASDLAPRHAREDTLVLMMQQLKVELLLLCVEK